jgi:hypothetical protein
MSRGRGGGGDQDGRWRRVGGGRPKRVEGLGAVTAGERGHVARSFTENQRGQTQWNKSCRW